MYACIYSANIFLSIERSIWMQTFILWMIHLVLSILRLLDTFLMSKLGNTFFNFFSTIFLFFKISVKAKIKRHYLTIRTIGFPGLHAV